MCKVCTEAVHCVALWTRVTLGLGMCKACTEGLDMCEVCKTCSVSSSAQEKMNCSAPRSPTWAKRFCFDTPHTAHLCNSLEHFIYQTLHTLSSLLSGYPASSLWSASSLFRIRGLKESFPVILLSARRMPNIFHKLSRKMLHIFHDHCYHSSLAAARRETNANGHYLRSLAVTCGHLLSAVTCGLSAVTCGHLLSAVTCGHLRSLEWLQVTASGWFSENQIPRSPRAQWNRLYLYHVTCPWVSQHANNIIHPPQYCRHYRYRNWQILNIVFLSKVCVSLSTPISKFEDQNEQVL